MQVKWRDRLPEPEVSRLKSWHEEIAQGPGEGDWGGRLGRQRKIASPQRHMQCHRAAEAGGALAAGSPAEHDCELLKQSQDKPGHKKENRCIIPGETGKFLKSCMYLFVHWQGWSSDCM